MTIDKSVLGEIVERLAEAVAAVERGNNRAAGVRQAWDCARTVLATGETPHACAK